MASRATLRSGTGARPMPTRTRSVHARAAPAAATEDSLKQSSHSQSSSRCRSAAAARGCSASGGRVGHEDHAQRWGRGRGHGCLTSSTRKPLLEVSRVHGIRAPCSIHRCRLSDPRLRLHDEVGHAGGGEPGEPGAQQRRGAPPCRPGSAGWTRSRSNRRSSGMPSAVVACTPSSPSAVGVAAGEVEGPLVDVERPHGGPGRAQGQGERDRPPTTAEVEEGAGGRRRGSLVEEHHGALVEPSGREDARGHLDLHLAAGEAHPQPTALVGAGRGGREVVVVLAHRRDTLAARGRNLFAPRALRGETLGRT